MEQDLEWIDAGNRLELRDGSGHLLAAEVTRDGRCIHFDLSEQKKWTLKNMIRRTIGLKPIYPPKVICAAYRCSEIGKARAQAAKSIQGLKKLHLDPASAQAAKRDIVRAFRLNYPLMKARH